MKRVPLSRVVTLISILALASCGGVSSGNAPLTAAEKVAAAKAGLAIEYAAGDSASSVTQNLTLPTNGLDGSTIAWSSSNTAVVSTTGTVTQPATQDANVILTATVSVDSASDKKAFPITVKAQVTEAQAVAAAKAALEIGYAEGDSAASVTQNVTLATSGIDNSAVTWASSDETVMNSGGEVTRPLTGDADITLTATITVGSASDTKAFPVTVKAQMTDAEAVAAAKSALAIGYAPGDGATSVTQDLTLPLTGADGTSVSWASSDAAISATGVVARPATGDLPVTLTATIRLNAANDTKVFIVTVKEQMTDEEAVAAAKAALAIGYAQGDSATSVTQNLTLPVTGSSACTISWRSSDPKTISTDGMVQQPAIGNEQVTLMATISSHDVSDTAKFSLTVIGQMSDEAAVAAAKAALNLVYASGDSAASVTQNVGLPTTGADACTISWSSDSPAVISTVGVVTQPQDDPMAVSLTATISSHDASDTKTFVLTVQPVMSDVAAVAADKAALTIGYGPGDSASHVTGNIVLPTAGVNGSTVTWASSDPSIISISGGVTVPSDSDANVTMTATITRGLASDMKDLPLTVKALLLSSWINVNAISPGNGAIEVDPGIVIKIPFQSALDANTVNTDSFQMIQTSNSQNVPITVSYDAGLQTVSLAPQSALEQNTQYSVIVGTTLKDSNEASLPSTMGFSFTTLSYEDILSQWKFNGDGSDASGNGNILMDITGGFDTDIVHEGSASLYVDGTGQNATSNISLGTQLTVAVWVNVDNPIQPSINTIMANAFTQEETNGFKLGINGWNTSDQSVVIEVGDGLTGGKWVTQPNLIQPGSWYHLAFVIDEPNQVIQIYYNGAEAPLSFTSDQGYTVGQFHYDFKTSGPFTIGSFLDGSYGFKGHLDDMRIYNRVLSADEIAKIAQEK